MTSPMMQPGMQPPAPPPPQPFTPFLARANDTEPAVAMQWMKRLSKLLFDPRFQSFSPLWQQLVNDKYKAAQQVIQAVTPLPALPKGIEIRAQPLDAASLAGDAQAALHGTPPSPGVPAGQPVAKQPTAVPMAPQTRAQVIPKMPV